MWGEQEGGRLLSELLQVERLLLALQLIIITFLFQDIRMDRYVHLFLTHLPRRNLTSLPSQPRRKIVKSPVKHFGKRTFQV